VKPSILIISKIVDKIQIIQRKNNPLDVLPSEDAEIRVQIIILGRTKNPAIGETAPDCMAPIQSIIILGIKIIPRK